MDSFDGSNSRKAEIEKVLEVISKDYFKERIDNIRYHYKENEKSKADKLKRDLPGFTPYGTFSIGRREEYLETYSGLIHLDYDNVENPQELKELVSQIPYTYASFISPSGKGLKVFIKTNSTIELHKEAFNTVTDYYDNILDVESDHSVKDLARFCYVSQDPELYLNKESQLFDIQEDNKSNISLEWVWNFTLNVSEFRDGNRNNFIHLFACNANRNGFEIEETLDYANTYSDSSFTNTEIDKIINGVYHRNAFEKGKVAILAKLAKTQENDKENPYISEDIYQKLPLILREACDPFKGRERDVFLTTSLSVISGGLYNVTGLYDKTKIYPNLFSMVIAPPASGKGSMKYSRILGDVYHDTLLKNSQEEYKKYKTELKIYEKRMRKAKDDEIHKLKEPEKPKANVFYIPGDTSSSMFVKHLEDNNGMGCVCETETDTVTKTLKQDWGGYSDVLRKGFHSELISKSRKENLEYCQVKEPKFSVAITGTPSQMSSLITSIEDGLFSRFMFYSYKAKAKWRNTYSEEASSKEDYFNKISEQMFNIFNNKEKQVFKMTRSQGEMLDNRFRDLLSDYSSTIKDCEGVIIRLGVTTYKIAMVLTALRSDDSNLICSDIDFESAIDLVEKVYLQHSLSLFNHLVDHGYTENEKSLLKYMPYGIEIKRSDIAKCIDSLKITDRNLTNILAKFCKNNDLKKIKNGVYIKR